MELTKLGSYEDGDDPCQDIALAHCIHSVSIYMAISKAER